MKGEAIERTGAGKAMPGGWVGWLMRWLLPRLRGVGRRQPRLEVLERIALAPRQSLSLIEAEGRRFLVATSPEGAPAFYALDERIRPSGWKTPMQPARVVQSKALPARVSW
jgi:flagellar biogenesis protein FliO